MNVTIARTAHDIEAAYETLVRARNVGCDTETSGFDAWRGRLLSVQFSDGDFNCLIPMSEGVGLGKLAQILENPAIVKIFHNARFDLEFLKEYGFTTRNLYDTMIAEKILTRGANQSVSLSETLYRYFAVDLDKSQRQTFTRKWNGVWTKELVHYALSDVVHLPELKRQQELWLERLGLTERFQKQMQKIV